MEENGHSTISTKDVDDWLPITGDRHAKWWYASFHNVTAMVGAGVLSLPNDMVYLTWLVTKNLCLSNRTLSKVVVSFFETFLYLILKY